MSQALNIPVSGEPQSIPLPASQGTTVPAVNVQPPAQTVDQEQVRNLQGELERARAEVARYKGFQSDMTWATQAGLTEKIKEFRASHKNPAEFTAVLSQQAQAAQALSEYGGADVVAQRLREWQEIQAAIRRDGVYVPIMPGAPLDPSQQPVPVQTYQPQPQVQSPGMTPDEVRAIARQETQETTAGFEREQAFSEVVDELSKDLVDPAHPPTPELQTMLRGAVEADLSTLLAGSRPPSPEEIGAAGARVYKTLLGRARASGAALTGNPATTGIPPLSNGAGPGGQLPAKPRDQMTTEEKMAAITEQIRKQAAAQGLNLTSPVPADPNISFG